ncbi:MAG: UvrD-helicase domain-containing protein [Bacteroidales bacterium]|nr:UvrD-helicase domain-containing protein [Bacteroidales bacterium]
MIEILKASAGSGKTFALAKHYISLLLKSDDIYAYRHILAVTFTNKATDEMKRRILKELNILAKNPSESDYHDDFVPSLFADDKSLSEKSLSVLSGILHDYGAFAVSTIDKFFQQTLRAFSKEIGHFASYQIELDRKGLVEESVDRVLDSLTDSKEDSAMLSWIADNTISNIENRGYFSLEGSLKDMAVRLSSAARAAKCEQFGVSDEDMFSPDAVKALSGACDDLMGELSTFVKNAVKRLRDELDDAGLDPAATSRGFVAKILNNNKDGWEKTPTKNEIDNLSDTGRWFKKDDKISPLRVTAGVLDAAAALAACFKDSNKLYNTAKILKGQIYGFGVAAELSRSLKELLVEKNVLSLDDTNTILRDIIDGTDAPFIYEKMGVRFENFLLDEFQDTSRIQWDNFRPLLRNSISSGNENLIVGDVKQSIYRWRDSDWKLLGEEIPSEFGEYLVKGSLDTNWRSRKNIVEFNNDFFRFAASMLDKLYGGGSTTVSGMYSDVKQEVSPKKDSGGYVNVTLCEKDHEPERVVEIINSALQTGYSLGDIAILVRGHEDGGFLSNYLIDKGIPVVTDDSLLVRSAATVKRLESLLGVIDNPGDSFALTLSEELDIEIPGEYHSLIELCEILLESLRKKFPEIFKAETLYIQSYMDKLKDFLANDGNELHAFLEKMKGDKSYISSPSNGDYVRMITIHKSKGLDFPVVIVPLLESTGLFRSGKSWCKPDLSGTSLSEAAAGVYDVTLSDQSEDTFFEKDFKDEKLLQYIDNLNIAYVAFTRAAQAMFIVGGCPGKKIEDFSGIMDAYLHEKNAEGGSYSLGELTYYPSKKSDQEHYEPIDFEYVSVPMNGRLGISRDCSDFFDDEGVPGGSARLKGVALHSIMEGVTVPADLDSAIDNAVFSGALDAQTAQTVKEVLSTRIASAAAKGWFPDDASQVWDEVDIIASDGSLHRPDRVIRRPDGSVLIIDYKFGAQRDSYEKQVRQYAMLYKSMGYENVEAVLWYVWEDVEKKVSL